MILFTFLEFQMGRGYGDCSAFQSVVYSGTCSSTCFQRLGITRSAEQVKIASYLLVPHLVSTFDSIRVCMFCVLGFAIS